MLQGLFGMSCMRLLRVYTDVIQFIEDGSDVAFYKNSAGVAQKIAVEENGNISDSGVDMGESK